MSETENNNEEVILPVAVLDGNGALVGITEKVVEDTDILVDPDLPTDGSLMYDAKLGKFIKVQVSYAILNEDRYLVGIGRKSRLDMSADDVPLPDACDLPTDGTYKWDSDRKTFFPLGHGFQRISTQPPMSNEALLYSLAQAHKDNVRPEVKDWMRWYEENLKARDEERYIYRRKRGRV